MIKNFCKRIFSNPFIFTIFLIPVIPALILTCIGFYFGTHQYEFGIISDHLYGKPRIVKAHYPSSKYKIGPVGSYQNADMYDPKVGEQYDIDIFDNFATNDLDTLSAIINKNVFGERKQVLLKHINFYRILRIIERKLNVICLDWLPIIIGLLIFSTVYFNFGRRILIVTIWYLFWYFMGVFGYFAYWLYPFRQPQVDYLYGFYREYCNTFSAEWLAITLLIEIFIIIPAICFIKFILKNIFPKVVLEINKFRGMYKF